MKYLVKTVMLKTYILEEEPAVLKFLEEGWEPFSVSTLGYGAIVYLRKPLQEEYKKVEATSWEL